MLSDQDRELLTAFVDGQLSARQRKAALRLLHRSQDARHLLRKLQEDARALSQLPIRKLPPDFSLKLMKTIAARGLQPGGNRPLPLTRGMPTWAGITAAAAVLLLVGTASFIYFGDRFPPEQGVSLHTVYVPQLDPVAGALVRNVVDGYAKPVKAGVYIPLSELTQQAAKKRLATELKAGPAHQLVLEGGNSAGAVQRLSNALKKNGIQVLVDPAAQARIKQKQPKTYIVYAENLHPDEVASVLEQFARYAAPPGELPCENALLNPMSAADGKELSRLLNEPLKLVEPIFEPRDGPKGKSKTGRQPDPKALERFAIVLASDSPAGTPRPSEIARFLASRREPRPGTVRVYMVVHEASA
jgi:hypothetical protein